MRVGDSIWHSARINEDNAEIAEFAEPTEIRTRFNYLTVQPSISRHDLRVQANGETIYGDWSIVANARCFDGKIKYGDLFWVDGATPIAEVEEEFGYGASANAEVVAVMPVNISISIVLRKRQNQITEL
jgi:hypothetical protein